MVEELRSVYVTQRTVAPLPNVMGLDVRGRVQSYNLQALPLQEELESRGHKE